MRITQPRQDDYFLLKNATYIGETDSLIKVAVEVRVYPKDEIVTAHTWFSKQKSFHDVRSMQIYAAPCGIEEAEIRIAKVLKKTYPKLTCVGIEHYD